MPTAILIATILTAIGRADAAAALPAAPLTRGTSAQSFPAALDAPVWMGDTEDGSLSDWYAPDVREGDHNGGGIYNSGSGTASATDEHARTGSFATKAVLSDGAGGVRLFRWRELLTYRSVEVGAWLYFPAALTTTIDTDAGGFLDIFQFKSTSADGTRNDPFWYIDLRSAGDGTLRPELVWWNRDVDGPHAGERGFRRYTTPSAVIPIGRWFKLSATIRQSSAFDGALDLWLDETKVFELRDVRTGYSNCRFNTWCVNAGWSINLYSNGLAPAPAVMYVDDAYVRPTAGGTITRPPPSPTGGVARKQAASAPHARVSGRPVSLRRRTARVRVTCPGSSTRAYTGRLRLRTVSRVWVGSRKRLLDLGSRRIGCDGGETLRVPVRLSARNARIVRRRHRLRVRATVVLRDEQGRLGRATTRFTLKGGS